MMSVHAFEMGIVYSTSKYVSKTMKSGNSGIVVSKYLKNNLSLLDLMSLICLSFFNNVNNSSEGRNDDYNKSKIIIMVMAAAV